MRRRALALLIVALPLPAAAQWQQTFTDDPHAGIHRETWKDMTLPVTLRAMRIDLTNSEILLVATSPDHRGMATSAFSTLESAAVAINGDSFTIGDYSPIGPAMGLIGTTPMYWGGQDTDGSSAVFSFTTVATPTTGSYTVAQLLPTGLDVTTPLPEGTLGVVSGRPVLVRSGVAVGQYDCNDARAIACVRAPRSALALSNNGQYLWMIVVDGWQTDSLGLTDAELATFLSQSTLVTGGVDSAMALDSGASSTLVADGVVISKPSDGVEHAVANHLAVQFTPVKSGSLIGYTCRTNIIPCTTMIPAVTVTLDNGRTVTSDSQGLFQITNLTPRYTCEYATATGVNASKYYPAKRCVVVGPGPDMTWGSIALKPCPSTGCLPADAGVPDAPIEYPDASPLIDGGAGGRDGGNPAMGPGGGCCDAGQDRPPWPAILLVVCWLARRRGTVA